MEQEATVDHLVRRRIRALRLARNWSLDTLAERSYLSPSNLSRIETGARRIALDQLIPIAKALGVSLDQLIETTEDDDVVIRPHHDDRGTAIWSMSPEHSPQGLAVAKMRFTTGAPPLAQAGVHPGRDWFLVLSGTAELRLGERLITVAAGEAAEFSTMTPHGIGAHGRRPAEILTILTRDGLSAHARDTAVLTPDE